MDTSIKTCKRCGETKPTTAYNPRNKQRKTAEGAAYTYHYIPNFCADCERAAVRAWGQTEHGKERRQETLTKFRASESGKASIKAYWQSEKGTQVLRRYNASGKGKARQKRWKQSERGKLAQFRMDAKRRGWEDATPLTFDEWKTLVWAFDGRCAYCRKVLRWDVPDEHPDALHRDHVRSLRRGGATVKENIVPACQRCNTRKGRKRRLPKPPIRPLPWPVVWQIDETEAVRQVGGPWEDAPPVRGPSRASP